MFQYVLFPHFSHSSNLHPENCGGYIHFTFSSTPHTIVVLVIQTKSLTHLLSRSHVILIREKRGKVAVVVLYGSLSLLQFIPCGEL